MKGVFIAFEGPEGGGKSTQIRRLGERLRREGLDPLLTREPGGTPLGDAVREVVLDPSLEVSSLSEFLLYSASRAQHVVDVIAPALRDGRVVVSDRFAGASVAYQGYGRGLDLRFVSELSRVATGGIDPHLTVLLDLEPEAGLQRIADRGASDRLERADLEFHRRVREGFLTQARSSADWLVVDALQAEDVVAEQVWLRVADLLERPPRGVG